MKYPKDLTGLRFGRLVVMSQKGTDIHRNKLWECKCDCGNIATVRAPVLKNGVTQSCGCLMNEVRKTSGTSHGLSNTHIYHAWQSMIARCCYESSPSYKDYGARGITICDKWRNSFETFYKDMGPRPTPHHTVERRENDKGYSKENCYWATKAEQANNRRSNILYEYCGEVKTLKQWCDILGLQYSGVYHRIKVLGWSFENAIQPIELYPVTYNGVTLALLEWCWELKLPYNNTYLRFLNGESLESIVNNPP